MNTKKTLLVLMSVLVGIHLIYAQKGDFRKSNWGQSLANVKGIEGASLLSEEPTRLVYSYALAGIPGELHYVFSGSNHLMRTKYLLRPEYLNVKFYIRDYKLFQEILIQKYGQPSSRIAAAVNEPNVPESMWSSYLAAGAIRFETVWIKDKIDISLSMSLLEEQPVIQIDFMSREYSNMNNKERSERIAKEL